MFTVRIDDSQLQRKINQFAAATGRTVKEETRTVFKSMVRDAIAYTPPGSQKAQGTSAKKAGEGSIYRDLGFRGMGFAPRKIKGYKTYKPEKGFWGHKLKKKLIIPTKLNPKFADPEGFRRQRLARKTGRVATRGQAQAFYVDQKLYKPMVARLILEVGRLASGWANAANQLGVPVPAWIARHAETFSRGSPVIITETPSRITMKVTNRFPEGTVQSGIADQMIRLIQTFIKPAAIGRLQRQLDARLRGLWKQST